MERHRYVEDPVSAECCYACSQSPLAPVHREPTPNLLEMDALGFAEFVAQLAAVARDLGLVVPAFRSDPRSERKVHRYPNSVVVVVPGLRGRPAAQVKADLIDGTLAANDLHHDHPKRWRLQERMEDA